MNTFLHEFHKHNFVCSQNVSGVFLRVNSLILVVVRLKIFLFFLQFLRFVAYFISELKDSTRVSYIKRHRASRCGTAQKGNCILLARNTTKFLVYSAAYASWLCCSNIHFIKYAITNGLVIERLVCTWQVLKISQFAVAVLSHSRLILGSKVKVKQSHYRPG
jgi:hypothetical protein